ncbi:hypothetical protein BKA70DRAFT_1271474 [Coprinopsis sp. MPI-PUGE-AT-0042]|nr:hypothetical protein BKA70DRAFT_1271474 [Coprinopsis sp. MPI-PUGE-AT-0042]
MSSSVALRSGRLYLGTLPRRVCGRQSSRHTSTCPSFAPGCTSTLFTQTPARYQRGLSTSALCRASYSTSTTFAGTPQKKEHRIFQDTQRPEVFYHLVDAPTPVSATNEAYAISFIDSLEAPIGDGGANGVGSEGANSTTVVGWVPLNAEGKPVWSAFKENPAFRPILHETIYAALRDGVDEVWTNGAKQIGNGWMHLHDQRNPPALGRIGDPDDILGTVLVEDGCIKADTYQPMPSYRVYTPTDGAKDSIGGYGRELGGFIKLTPGLLQRLIQSAWRAEKNEKVQSPV